jgi:N-glycosylase/DNA lyase
LKAYIVFSLLVVGYAARIAMVPAFQVSLPLVVNAPGSSDARVPSLCATDTTGSLAFTPEARAT